MTNPIIFWTLLSSNAYEIVKDFVLFLQGKSRDIVYQRICLFLWSIFTQHGLFEIQLTVYSALSHLTDLGIYDITRGGIWLLTIFHIPYIHFQRELRKVTSPKWYLSFFVQYSNAAVRVWFQVSECVRGSVTLYLVDRIATTVFAQSRFQTSHAHSSWWQETSYWFWVTGSKVKVNIGTFYIKPYGKIQTKVFAQLLSNFICKLWMIKGVSLLILGLGVKG